MFKFFREYNKIILVVGCILLMIAFLVPQGIEMLAPGRESYVIGHIQGDEVTLGDQQQAAFELQLLSLFPVLSQVGFTPQTDDALRWHLMLHEARNLGLSASIAEANEIVQLFGADETQLAQVLRQSRATRDDLDRALIHWLMVQDYIELFIGVAHQSALTKLTMGSALRQAYQQGNIFAAYQMQAAMSPSQRLSPPLVRHFVQAQQATVDGKAVLIPATRCLDQAPAPTPEQVQKLYDEHKDDLPGSSEPYGFGYKTPDRVKIEWLTFPADVIRNAVQINEADALAYYQQNQSQFTAAPPATTDGAAPAAPATQPYTAVRNQVFERLRRQKADELAQQVVKAAQDVLREDPATRRLPQSGGYRDVPADFRGMTLEEVAAKVAERFNIRPTVRARTDNWVNLTELSQLDGLGDSGLASRMQVTLADYLRSAREMKPDAANPLVPLRLQVGLPGEPMRSYDGNYFLFRLVAAEPARVPELDEVRAQVTEDARKLAAYDLLLKETDTWVQRAKSSGLDALASEVGVSVSPIDPTSRGSAAPGQKATVPGIGEADALLGQMFQLGQQITEKGDLAAAPPADRIGAAPVERKLSLAVFRLDGFKPMTESAFKSATADNPLLGYEINATLFRATGEEEPLSLEAIEKRVGYVPAQSEG